MNHHLRFTLAAGLAVGLIGALPASAVIYSPTQAELFDLTDVTVDFGGGGSLFSKTLSGDGVLLDVDLLPGGDTVSRVVLENQNFTTDLTGFDGFDLLLEPLSLNQDLNAKTYLRTGDSGFFEPIATQTATFGGQTRLSLDLTGVPDLDDVRGFGIQLFNPGGGSAFAVQAMLDTAPQPPTFVTTQLFSWETPDDGGTPINEQFEGWTEGFQPDHTHTIGSTGVTDGSSSLRVARSKGPSDPTFRWGTEIRINTDPTSTTEDFDPDGQPVIDAIAAALAGTGARVLFDVTIDPADVDVSGLGAGENPFFGVGMAINTGTFFQTGQQFVNGNDLVGTELIEFTFEAAVDTFGDLENNLPASDGSQTFVAFHISTNTNVPLEFNIDNLRVIAEGSAAIDGDYNGDGSVDQGDLDLVLLNWGDDASVTGVPAGWINMQPAGLIGQTELDGVLLNWGNTAEAAASSVPEPGTLALLGLGAALLRRQR